MGVRAAALVLLLAYPITSLAAQDGAAITLSISQGGKEVGREELTLTRGRGRGAPGTTLTATARYPAVGTTKRLTAQLERTPEFAIAKFQLDVESPEGTTVILAAGSGARLIVRTVARGSESGRELPGGPDIVLLDEDVMSLYAADRRSGHAGGQAPDGDLPTHRQARVVHRAARRDGSGRAPAGRSHRRHRGHAEYGQRGTAPSPGAAGAEQGRHAGGVVPLPNSFSDSLEPRLCRNLKPMRRGRRIGPGHVPSPKGIVP